MRILSNHKCLDKKNEVGVNEAHTKLTKLTKSYCVEHLSRESAMRPQCVSGVKKKKMADRHVRFDGNAFHLSSMSVRSFYKSVLF